MGSRLRRGLAIGAAAVVALVVLLVAILHTPPVRTRALAWVIGQLETRFSLRLTADGLSYNLLAGGVTLTNVRLAAKDALDEPFFTATRVHASVPLTAYTGKLVLDDVAIVDGRVTITTDAEGRSNLPGSRGGPPPDPARSLALRGLHLTDFAFLYDDRTMPLRIAASDIDSALDPGLVGELTGTTGPFAIRGGVDVEWGDRTLRVEPLETRIGFDGSNVTLDDLPIVTTMANLNVSGRLNRVLDAFSLELGFDGQVDVARAASWAPPPIPVSGTTRVKGTINGAMSAIEIVTRFDAPALTVGTEEALSAGGEVMLDRSHLLVDRVVASPRSGGEVNAAVDVPFGDAPVTVTASWRGVDARAMMRAANITAQPIGARLEGEARFATGPRRSLTVRTNLAPFEARGVTPLGGTANVSLNGSTWRLVHNLRSTGITVIGSAGGQLNANAAARSTVSGPSSVKIASLAAADRALAPFGIRIPDAVRNASGAIDAEATVDGTFGNPRTTVVAKAPAFDVPGVGVSAVSATVEADRRLVNVSPLSLVRDGTEAAGSVTIDLTKRTLGGALDATVPDAKVLQAQVPEEWQVSASLSAHATLEGTFDVPVIVATVASPVLEFAGDTYTNLEGGFTFKDRAFSVPRLAVRKDDGELSLKGRFGLDNSYQADLQATNLSWGRMLVDGIETRIGVGGSFSGTGTFDRPMGNGEFVLNLFQGEGEELTGGTKINVELQGRLARFSLQTSTLGLSANGTIATAEPFDYRVAAVVNQLDLSRIAPLLDIVPTDISGQLSLDAALNGAVQGDAPPTLLANLQQVTAQVEGVPVNLIAPASISWSPGEVTVRDLTATIGSGTLNAEGTWAGRDSTTFSTFFRGEVGEVLTAARAFKVETNVVANGWLEANLYGTNRREDLIGSFDITNAYVEAGSNVKLTNINVGAGIRGETLTLHSISGSVDAAKASGTFTGKGEATIPELDPKRTKGRFELDSATFDTAGVEVKQTRPTTIVVDGGLIKMDDVVWEAAGSQIALGGSVDLSPETPTLDLTVKGIAVLRVLSAFIPALGVDGTANVDFRVGGTTTDPDLSGSITLDDAEVALPSPRIVLSDLTGPIVLSGNRITLRGLTGSANGGALTIDGGFVLKGTAIVDGEVYVQAVGMAVEFPRGLRSEIDALLTYDIGEATPILRGDVRVQRSSYTEAISLAALARANAGTTVRAPTAQPSALENLRLNVTVTTVEDMRVDNNYGRFEGGAQLRIVGTAARPGMSGRVTLREGGQIFAAGRTFTLSAGTVSFTDLTRIQPDLNIQAETRLARIGAVNLTVSGTPDRFEFDLTAPDRPEVTQEEIAQALLGGGVTGANAVTLLSTDLLGATGRQIGLDALRIERGDVVADEFREDPSALLQDEDPVTRLTLSKRLSDQVEFTVSQNLAQSGRTTILVSYYPLRNLEIRAISRDDGTQGLGVRHQITFGGDSRPRVAAERVVMTVKDVLLEGTFTPFTAEQLREHLRIRPGQPFDFYSWQRDLDGIRERFLENGRVEARVRGRRDPAGENAINVVYTVIPGPATRVVIDGFQVGDSVIRDIEQSWSRGVFDRFIVQDAETRVHGELLQRGYISASVTGTMESGDDSKTLHLKVVPGTALEGREFRFIGNAAVSRNELETAIIQWNMAEFGWLDHEALAGTLRAFYRQQGFLDAQVSIDGAVEENGRAVLPIKIDEGARAAIGEVRWSGVSDAHAAAIERAAGLSRGGPYALTLVEAARDRVDRYYRRLGFNSVQVGATAAPPNDEGQLDIDITVTEGPQQILRGVDTSGATRTREGIVTRALNLKVGQPVNLEEWAMARKRLFDTNVFRSVDIQPVPLGDPVNNVQPVQARVSVEEYPPWRFRYGVQADREHSAGLENPQTDLNLGVIAELRNQNLFGRAITGGVSGLQQRNFQRAQVFLQTASFFGLPLRSGLFLSNSSENVREDTVLLYKEDRQVLTFEQRYRRRRGLEVTYGYRYENLHQYDPDPDPTDIFPLDLVTHVGKLRTALLWDRRDDPISPRTGTFTSVSYERAAPWLGSYSRYGRVLVQQFAFRTLGPVVLAGRVIGGDFTGVPNVDLFQAGGATTVRGYGENTLGVRLPDGTIAGTTLMVLNQEVRFPIRGWIGGVGFVDAGNTFNSQYPFAFSELKVGYGVGLRFSSPIGLLRLDFGIPASSLPTSGRRANDFGSGRFYFGLGHIF